MNIQPFLEKGFCVSVDYWTGGKFAKVAQIPGKGRLWFSVGFAQLKTGDGSPSISRQ